MKLINTLLALLISTQVLSQSNQATQTIRGKVVDAESQYGLPGVNVMVVDSNPIKGSSTDVNGYFNLTEIPIGRVNLKFSFIGYEDAYQFNVPVKVGKESIVDISLQESFEMLDEIVVSTDIMEHEVSELATVSARGFNIEETKRYAGSFNDPARMAANFAGVSAVNDGRNDIIIRGNSPTGLLWRLEGLDIPNPNHYGVAGGTGGPVTILNNNQLANSEFYTGAFPAMYSNATSGVFDLRLRNGNYQKNENILQLGFNGLELGTEGPINRKNRSSYMINYRYSIPAIVSELGFNDGTRTAVPTYQDLSFKLNFPKKNSNFKIFGLGGLSDIDLMGSETNAEDAQKDLYGDYNLDIFNESNTGMVGSSYQFFFNPNTYWSNSVLVSGNEFMVDVDTVLRDNNLTVQSSDAWAREDFKQWKVAYTSEFNKKINVANTLNAGFTYENQHFDFTRRIVYSPSIDDYNGIGQDGSANLMKAYASWQHKFSKKLLANTGVSFLHYDLNDNSSALELRLGLQYRPKDNQKVSLAYGRHNQTQVISVYFNETTLPDGSVVLNNKDLGFTQSDHFVGGYEIFPIPTLRIRSEVYYQDIRNAAVSPSSGHFSMLNEGHDFGFTDKDSLYNGGTGSNMGAEITVEKFLNKGWYLLTTTSLYDSKYKGSDGIERNTIYNGNVVFNLLTGKEWSVGKKNNTLSVDARMTYAGNKRFIPIDLQQSNLEGREVLTNQAVYEGQLPYYFRSDLKITFRKPGKKITEEYVLDIQNVTDRNNVQKKTYSTAAQDVSNTTQLGMWPMFTYRLLF